MRVLLDEVAMADGGSGMGISFHTEAGEKRDFGDTQLAERVRGAVADGDDNALHGYRIALSGFVALGF